MYFSLASYFLFGSDLLSRLGRTRTAGWFTALNRELHIVKYKFHVFGYRYGRAFSHSFSFSASRVCGTALWAQGCENILGLKQMIKVVPNRPQSHSVFHNDQREVDNPIDRGVFCHCTVLTRPFKLRTVDVRQKLNSVIKHLTGRSIPAPLLKTKHSRMTFSCDNPPLQTTSHSRVSHCPSAAIMSDSSSRVRSQKTIAHF